MPTVLWPRMWTRQHSRSAVNPKAGRVGHHQPEPYSAGLVKLAPSRDLLNIYSKMCWTLFCRGMVASTDTIICNVTSQ
jgi:hypothetical protein